MVTVTNSDARVSDVSDRFGDDNAGRTCQRTPLQLAPAALCQPAIGIVLAVGLTFAGEHQKFARCQRRVLGLRAGRVEPDIDQQQAR